MNKNAFKKNTVMAKNAKQMQIKTSRFRIEGA